MTEPTDDNKPTITPRPHGPLIVKGLGALRNSKGEALRARATVALCRCGGSATKPFCDGTHSKIGFDSTHTAERAADRQERFEGPAATILDNRFICAHVGACTDGLPQVFRYGEEPWIDPAGADGARIREAIARCPSGALSFAGEAEPAQESAITVSKDGPYYVVGGCTLETDAWGQGASRERYALCRCGQSKTKPFCDGSHWEAKFTDEGN